ncbi:FHA domain-containing protein [Janibacter sp. CX7]|uniref:FHA domain-containing protein FhaB/FipA n=1 Tax=Janibacter sp. CX7 TaxID=2963431 RepID=UPI0020CB7B9A|nr:FHA domain-containing protein [Janibacter sp. CX7]UTT66169.1 FHA domain-containing protein [Janibacter sp. CX7]
MSELTVTVLRLGLLVLLWVFVLSVASVLRTDLFGTRVVNRRPAPPKKAARRGAKGAAPVSETPRPPRNPRTPTHLVLTTGPLTGTSLPLRESGVLIGRNPECALVLDDEFASGRHARIIRGEDGWYVEDLGSTNGTFLGQYRVGDPVPVETGTSIRIGRTVIELRN